MTKYYQVTCKVRPEIEAEVSEIAIGEYQSLGIEDFSIDEERVDNILGERSYSGGDVPQSVVTEVESVVTEGLHAKKFYFNDESQALAFTEHLNVRFELTADFHAEDYKDWNEEWKKSYKPIRVSDKLEIIPEWEKFNYKTNSKIPLYIYPGQGFGTGSHETTFLCLKLYTELESSFSSCLDFGCGSGILGIGFKLFDKDSLCHLYDIDIEALKNCEQNIKLNDLELKDFSLILPKDRSQIDNKYKLVFANILQNVLLEEINFLSNSLELNGYLILSGLLVGQEELIIKEYTELNPSLEYVKAEYLGDWVAILMKKTSIELQN